MKWLQRVRGFLATELSLFAGAHMFACMIADLTGGLFLIGAVCWLFIYPRRPIRPD